jgi:hypothetical protein
MPVKTMGMLLFTPDRYPSHPVNLNSTKAISSIRAGPKGYVVILPLYSLEPGSKNASRYRAVSESTLESLSAVPMSSKMTKLIHLIQDVVNGHQGNTKDI